MPSWVPSQSSTVSPGVRGGLWGQTGLGLILALPLSSYVTQSKCVNSVSLVYNVGIMEFL